MFSVPFKPDENEGERLKEFESRLVKAVKLNESIRSETNAS